MWTIRGWDMWNLCVCVELRLPPSSARTLSHYAESTGSTVREAGSRLIESGLSVLRTVDDTLDAPVAERGSGISFARLDRKSILNRRPKACGHHGLRT